MIIFYFFQIQDAFATELLIPAVITSETEAVEDNLIEQSEDIKFTEPQTHLVTEGKKHYLLFISLNSPN